MHFHHLWFFSSFSFPLLKTVFFVVSSFIIFFCYFSLLKISVVGQVQKKHRLTRVDKLYDKIHARVNKFFWLEKIMFLLKNLKTDIDNKNLHKMNIKAKFLKINLKIHFYFDNLFFLISVCIYFLIKNHY